METKKPRFTLPFEKPLMELEKQLQALRETSETSHVDLSAEIAQMEVKLESTKREVYKNLSAWDRILLARHPQRPYALDHIEAMFTDFQELHGDRLFKDDAAIVAGTALLDGKPVAVIGQQKGRNTKENIMRNFGYPNPEGYRKALRIMRLAHKFKMPIVCIVDTPGAFPGVGAEERHVAEAIAVNIREMSLLEVPIIAVVIGEGGSGGALGIALADRVLIMENAYYSVISPEGCAAILWKDRVHAPKAAEALKISAGELLKLGVVDEVIAEPFGGAHNNKEEAIAAVKKSITKHLAALNAQKSTDLLEARYQKYRAIGVYEEEALIENQSVASQIQ